MKIVGLRCLIDEATVLRRIDELAAEIDACYAGEPLVVVGVLKGGFMFFSDLVRRLSCRPELDFIRLSSYGYNTAPSGQVVCMQGLTVSVAGKHVLIVEDIVDTGHSMHTLMREMAQKNVRSLRLAALVDKQERREVPVKVDFSGFCVDAGFLVGYGLDYAEQCRELPGVYVAELGPDDAQGTHTGAQAAAQEPVPENDPTHDLTPDLAKVQANIQANTQAVVPDTVPCGVADSV